MHKNKNRIRWGIIFVSFVIVSLILWNTYVFFQRFKKQERIKMEILASAYKRLNDPDLDAEVELPIQIIESNYNTPMIVTDAKGKITSYLHLDSVKARKKGYLKKQLAKMKVQNEPLLIQYKNFSKQYIYYRDSKILTNLKYYPIALLLILFLFGTVIYLFTQSNKIATQNRLWTGMAKETAHQIGTPLTSLLGWVTMLREDKRNAAIADEIETDVHRLEIITNRFSKIGSTPSLKVQNIVTLCRKMFEYIQSRSSHQIRFEFVSSSDEIKAKTNPELLGWVIENLVKNAVDAIEGKGKITLRIETLLSEVIIRISDTGKGLPKRLFGRIFDPGFTTKKRGWGLGLALSKRIIQDFHNGRIFVQKSELNKGTTFCVKLQGVR